MVTPARKQYLDMKAQHPDALLWFRMGDFYEMFDEDARIAATALHITLTARPFGKDGRVPMAGVPYHAANSYLARLLRQGHRVAICEQLSPPGKGLVERAVVRVISPGTVSEPSLLAARENSYLAALCPGPAGYGLAYVDVTTGEFAATEHLHGDPALPCAAAENDLARIAPRECLVPRNESESAPFGDASQPTGDEGEAETGEYAALAVAIPCHKTPFDARHFASLAATETLQTHFGVVNLEAFGCAHLPLATRAAGAIVRYLTETNAMLLPLLAGLRTYHTQGTMHLDAATRHNLELHGAGRAGTSGGSLLKTLDGTKTAMGGRFLRRMLAEPLTDRAAIEARLDATEAFVTRTALRLGVLALLTEIGDMERLTARARQETATPRELIALRDALRAVPKLTQMLKGADNTALAALAARLDPCTAAEDLLTRAVLVAVAKEDTRRIRPGYDPDFDALVHTATHARETIAAMEAAERERTGIRSLKIKYNSVFGYGIEVSNANRARVPSDYRRTQTLTHAERYVTPALKEWEATVLHAEERITAREDELYGGVLREIGAVAPVLLGTARAIATVDVHAALADRAVQSGYVRPALTDGTELHIVAGRHPTVEAALAEAGESFVPNDTALAPDGTHLLLLTGPNMAGKSTYLRQVALVVLLAQVGSFVPADAATIGIVDRIFTRIGAQDDLAGGASTFLVEMMETANILRHATDRSLVVLDEVGRGTGTEDGVAIARAVCEDLADRVRARTLFATHYHGLAESVGALPGVGVVSAAVAEEDGTVTFLHRITPGASGKSYGLHVATLAGLPAPVVARARILMEASEPNTDDTDDTKGTENIRELRLWRGDGNGDAHDAHLAPDTPHPALLAEIAALDLARMTPLEAMIALDRIQTHARALLVAPEATGSPPMPPLNPPVAPHFRGKSRQ